MKQARMLGNYISHRAEELSISTLQLSQVLQCDDNQVKRLFNGRYLLSFKQIQNLSGLLKVSVDDLLKGDDEEYSKSVVHCMNDFSNDENRERILNYIDNYMDLFDSINGKDNLD